MKIKFGFLFWLAEVVYKWNLNKKESASSVKQQRKIKAKVQ